MQQYIPKSMQQNIFNSLVRLIRSKRLSLYSFRKTTMLHSLHTF